MRCLLKRIWSLALDANVGSASNEHSFTRIISPQISPYLPHVSPGEMALFHEDLKRNCNVAALSICDILRINTTQIKAVLDENPALHRPATV